MGAAGADMILDNEVIKYLCKEHAHDLPHAVPWCRGIYFGRKSHNDATDIYVHRRNFQTFPRHATG